MDHCSSDNELGLFVRLDVGIVVRSVEEYISCKTAMTVKTMRFIKKPSVSDGF